MSPDYNEMAGVKKEKDVLIDGDGQLFPVCLLLSSLEQVGHNPLVTALWAETVYPLRAY